MKPTEISKIRKLIELFYAGETTPRQEAQLRCLLESVEVKMLPEDLRAEKAFICVDVKPPEGLEERLSATIDALAALDKNVNSNEEDCHSAFVPSEHATKRKSDIKWNIIIRWCSSVAAAIVLGAVFFPLSTVFPDRNHDLRAMGDTYMATRFTPDAGFLAQQLSVTELPEMKVDLTLTEDAVTLENNVSGQKNKSKRRHMAHVAKKNITSGIGANDQISGVEVKRDGKIREITDPEEAQALINRAFSRVYRSMSIAQSSISGASLPFADNGRILDNVLQSENNL